MDLHLSLIQWYKIIYIYFYFFSFYYLFILYIMATNNPSYLCSVCGGSFKTKGNLKRHSLKCELPPPLQQVSAKKSKLLNSIACSACHEDFYCTTSLHNHLINIHHQSPFELYCPYIPQHFTADVNTVQAIQNDIHKITRNHFSSPTLKKYNFYDFTHISYDAIDTHMDYIFKSNTSAYKLNISFGYILYNQDTDSARYFYPEKNFLSLQHAATIVTYQDILRIRVKIRDIDIIEEIFNQRPDSKHRVICTVNVLYFIYIMEEYLLGGNDQLSQYIMRNRSLINLHASSTGRPHRQNLCMFRALSYHNYRGKQLEKHTKQYFSQWYAIHQIPLHLFKGVTIQQLPTFEETFKVNVFLYQLHEDNTATSLYRSISTFPSTLYLNKHNLHISYISRMALFSPTFKCDICSKIFPRTCSYSSQDISD